MIPSAWRHECYVPVAKESFTACDPELSIHARKVPVSASLRVQNDSDQCSECRCAPGQSHAPGCERTAQNYNEHINAAPEHPDCWLPTIPDTAPSGDVAGSDDNPFRVSTENEDFYKGEFAALMAEGYREMAEPEPARSAIGAGPLFAAVFDEIRVPDEWPETGNPLHAHMRATFDACLAISVAKNADYAGDDDPLANFRACQQFGVPLTKGIMVRLSDKFSRIGNLLDREAQVKDEAIADTIHDAIDYLAILKYALETETA